MERNRGAEPHEHGESGSDAVKGSGVRGSPKEEARHPLAEGTASFSHACEVALRHSDGPGFEATPVDLELAESVLASEVRLAPHAPAQLASPVDWLADPFGQRNWRAQLQMLRWLDPLRRVASSDKERRLALMKKWNAIVEDWAGQNLSPSKAAPSAWLSMVEAIRAETLINGLPLTDDPGFVLRLLARHGEWLADARHIGHSNHALRQHSALFQVGAVLGNEEWKSLAAHLLCIQFVLSILAYFISGRSSIIICLGWPVIMIGVSSACIRGSI